MTIASYRRILLKLSGEALMGDGQYGIDPATVTPHGRRSEGSQGNRA